MRPGHKFSKAVCPPNLNLFGFCVLPASWGETSILLSFDVKFCWTYRRRNQTQRNADLETGLSYLHHFKEFCD